MIGRTGHASHGLKGHFEALGDETAEPSNYRTCDTTLAATRKFHADLHLLSRRQCSGAANSSPRIWMGAVNIKARGYASHAAPNILNIFTHRPEFLFTNTNKHTTALIELKTTFSTLEESTEPTEGPVQTVRR